MEFVEILCIISYLSIMLLKSVQMKKSDPEFFEQMILSYKSADPPKELIRARRVVIIYLVLFSWFLNLTLMLSVALLLSCIVDGNIYYIFLVPLPLLCGVLMNRISLNLSDIRRQQAPASPTNAPLFFFSGV